MFVLILGSYDPVTKSVLYRLQRSIAKEFTREGHYGLLMENLELHVVNDELSGSWPVLIEKSEDSATFYIFNGSFSLDPNNVVCIETVPNREDLQYELKKFMIDCKLITEQANIDKKKMYAEDILDITEGLFNFIATISSLYLIVRLKDETRGGEYIELCYLTKSQNRVTMRNKPNIFLLKHRDVQLSSMLRLIIKDSITVIDDFCDETDLLSKSNEIIREFHNEVS